MLFNDCNLVTDTKYNYGETRFWIREKGVYPQRIS
jgi:hypothetical protein